MSTTTLSAQPTLPLKILSLSIHTSITCTDPYFLSTDLIENLWRDVWLGVEEVQHVARVLDAVFGRLLRRCEPVVSGAVEVLETARSVFQLIALTRYNGLLLGHAARKDDSYV